MEVLSISSRRAPQSLRGTSTSAWTARGGPGSQDLRVSHTLGQGHTDMMYSSEHTTMGASACVLTSGAFFRRVFPREAHPFTTKTNVRSEFTAGAAFLP